MSEEDVRDGLLNAVATEPPLRLDPDELVATARRQVRRRALVGVGVATVAVAVAAVAVPVALGRGPATDVPAAEQPTSRPTAQPPASTPEQWPPAGVKPAHYSTDELRARGDAMRAHLSSTLPSRLPSASDFAYGEFGGEASGQYYEGQTSINAAITFTIDGKRYSIMITSWGRGAASAPAEVCVADCRRLDDTANGPLYEQTDLLDKGAIETVFHYRDTGAMVAVAAYNYDMTSQVPPTYHPSLPITGDQLTAIATDPDLEL